jgi:hypothetical protein
MSVFGGPIMSALTFGLIGLGRSLQNKGNQSKGNINGIRHIKHSDALKILRFPPGHPLIDHSYAGHPLCEEFYFPFNSFHKWLFEEKVNELMTILASLCATRVRVLFYQGYQSGGGINFQAQIPMASGGIESKYNKDRESRAEFEEHFRPTGEPSIPKGLIWYGSEPSWQSLAKRRLDFNTSKFRVELRYADSFGVDASLKVGLENYGVQIGNYEDFETTIWVFEGEFA